MKLFRLSILLIALAMSISCNNDEEIKLSSDKNIRSFVVENIGVKIENNQIILTFPAYVKEFVIKPIITISDKAQISPASDFEINLNDVNQYIVTAEDGSQKIYSITIQLQNGIESVGIKYKDNYYTQTSNGIVDDVEKTITIDVPYSFLISSSFFISLKGHPYSMSVPQNNQAIDGENQTILYDKVIILDKDLNKIDEYKLIVRNTEAELKDISLPIISFGINPSICGWVAEKYRDGLTSGWDYVYFTLEGQDVSNIVPTLTYSKNATIKPGDGESVNFNNIVDFNITSESGISLFRKVKVVKKKIIIINDHDDSGTTIIPSSNHFTLIYNAISFVKNAWLVNEDTIYDCTVDPSYPYDSPNPKMQGGYNTTVRVVSTLPSNKRCRLRVELENGDIVDTDSYWKKAD